MRDDYNKNSSFDVSGIYEEGIDSERYSVFIKDGNVYAVDSEGRFINCAEVTHDGIKVAPLPSDFTAPQIPSDLF